ncbi:MAG: AAA family ATPase [Candidatus Promineofilum sp.]|nr:AAA family ATPase [Promineifilum sp.]
MEPLSAFLPDDRRRALSAGIPLPNRAQGAALFADISGFTPLTATLRHDLGSRRGTEELIRHLNGVFSVLIDTIRGYYGNVIGFSGDAITCWFDESDSGDGDPVVSSAADRAVAAAFALQAEITRMEAIITPAGTTLPLSIKVAVAAGPVRRLLVGDPQTYVMEALAGATIDRMSAAEKLAASGQVIVTDDTLAALTSPPVVIARPEAGGRRFALLAPPANPAPPPPPRVIPILDDETARPWLLPPVYEHLRQATETFLAEIRPAVPLFIKFGGIDYDTDETAEARLDIFTRRTQAILDHFEGYLLQITVGDKGSYFYAAFGAPLAHEDDAARAAAAALEINCLIGELDFPRSLQIGISQGLTHSGSYGGAARRAFAIMGNEVNLAARLMTAAEPGQILISPRIAEAIQGSFVTNALPPLTLKGIAKPFTASELLARKQTTGGRTPVAAAVIAGRESERTALDEALAQLGRGQSPVVIVDGAPGIGKSLLLRELARKAAAAEPSPLLLSGYGESVERSTPYFAWRPILERLLAEPAAGDQEMSVAARQEALLGRLSPESRPLATLLTTILPLDLPETELTGQMTGELRQEHTQRLILELLCGAAQSRPVALVFDDAHWLDSVSWALLDRVRREISPLLTVIATRVMGDDAPPIFRELQNLPGARHISLDSLSPAAVEELVCRRLGIGRLPPAIAQLIHNKAEGNPFFSEELAYALRDTGLLVIDGDQARLAEGADLEALDFPNTIQSVITSRIDRLPVAHQLTVKVASVIGRIFAFRLLDDIYPVELDEAALHEQLRRLEQLDITPMDEPEPNLAYIFKHLVTQEVVYGLMTSDQRRQLHRGAAVWHEEHAGDDPAGFLPLLAHHWRMAGNRDKAAVYYEKAGLNAHRDYANQEAIRFLEQAEVLSAENTPALQRAQRRRLMGDAHYRLTQIGQSLAEYAAALELLGRPLPRSAAGRGLGVGVALTRLVGHRLFPGRSIGHAVPDERAALLEASRVLEGAAETYYNLGDFLTSFYCTMTGFTLAERAGPSPELMRGCAVMCSTVSILGLHKVADGYRARALALESDVDDLPARAWSRVPLSCQSLWVGNWSRAEQEIDEALNFYTKLGDWRRWAVAAWVWPQVAQCRGQLERARDLWAELYAVALRSRDTRHQVRGRGGQFFNFLTLNEDAAAHDCLEAARSVMDENPEMMAVEERLWHAVNAAWALRRGDWAAARGSAEATLAAIDRARTKFDLLEVFATPAEVLLALGERGEATAAEAKTAAKALRGYARTYAFARPRSLRAEGRLARLSGDDRRAAKLWQKSLAQAEALGMPYEAALTQDLLA